MTKNRGMYAHHRYPEKNVKRRLNKSAHDHVKIRIYGSWFQLNKIAMYYSSLLGTNTIHPTKKYKRAMPSKFHIALCMFLYEM